MHLDQHHSPLTHASRDRWLALALLAWALLLGSALLVAPLLGRWQPALAILALISLAAAFLLGTIRSRANRPLRRLARGALWAVAWLIALSVPVLLRCAQLNSEAAQIPIPPGARVWADRIDPFAYNSDLDFTIAFDAPHSPEQIASFYERELTSRGWTVQRSAEDAFRNIDSALLPDSSSPVLFIHEPDPITGPWPPWAGDQVLLIFRRDNRKLAVAIARKGSGTATAVYPFERHWRGHWWRGY